MSIQEFRNEVRASLESIFQDCEVKNGDKVRINGGKSIGICIQPAGSNIAPCIYLESYYQDYREGKSMKDIINEIGKVYEDSKVECIDIGFMADYQSIRSSIAIKLINYERNEEFLQEIPHRKFMDLAIIYYIPFSNISSEIGTASVTIKNTQMEVWKVTEEELYEDAISNMPENMPAVIRSMEYVLMQFVDMDEDTGKKEMYFEDQLKEIDPKKEMMLVLTNESKLFGSSVMLYPGILSKIAERMESNIFLLPSSIHESILLMDDGEKNTEELLKMVTEVNSTEVQEEEILANNVYIFNRKTQTLEEAV